MNTHSKLLVVGTWIVAAVVVGCGGSAHQLNTLARENLQCDHNIVFTHIDDKTQRANGCGRQATFVQLCDVEGECNWMRDNTTQRSK